MFSLETNLTDTGLIDRKNKTSPSPIISDVQWWVGIPLMTTLAYNAIIYWLVINYNRSKPDSRRTVMDKLVENVIVIFVLRTCVGHIIWTLRGLFGPLHQVFAYIKVTSDRVTMFGGLSISLATAVLRYLHYGYLDRIQVNLTFPQTGLT